jgi:dihydroorotase
MQTIIRPDDWHLHLRDGESLASLGKHWPGIVKRAIIMPNLKPPVVNTEQAIAYRERILASLPESSDFEPLMTLYLTDNTSPDEIRRAKASGVVVACKLYPAGATTNSDSGVTDFEKVKPALEAMAEEGLVLCVHGEVTDPDVDFFEREPVFLERVLAPIVDGIPTLKVVLEHITTRQAVEFVEGAREGVGATITAHHLLYNRNAIFVGGLNPHMYCLPILKHELDRQALVRAVASGSPRFFAGTDSAPHPREAKECACGCAGIFTAHASTEFYTEALANAGALEHLEGFLSRNGANFYGLPLNTGCITLTPAETELPSELEFGSSVVVPLRPGGKVAWKAALVE